MTPEDLATARHAGQFRKGTNPTPYVTHCAEVAATVARHGGEAEAVSAAWLHDTVEDTETTLVEIDRLFGNAVAALVGEVTDDPSLSKEEQRRAQIATAPHKSAGAALIKAADQMSNLHSLVSSPPEWSQEKRLAYITKARAVVAGLSIPAALRAEFDVAALDAETFVPR
ncbi:HD domain-containing protein [Falsihalocynthiibacter sp. S25ZX9]|uniref:HD domain-containing protein n=1 Tax=Falsihalocynthiibacter sp. S25ZX9 TaxID=3240870 RepID=UPI00350EF513